MTRPSHFYESRRLDRAAHLRQDIAWLEAQLHSAQARLLPVWRYKTMVANPDRPQLAHHPLADFSLTLEDVAFVGLFDDVPYFAADFSHLDEPPVQKAASYEDLRAVGPLMEGDEGAVAALARGLVFWHRRHRFCGRCGSPTRSIWAGHKRSCTNPDCALDHFPRTDPAVIMLVHDGGDRVLLARAPQWPEGRHSVLAGFVEPSESLEQAVAREVYEEVGINVGDIRYHSSQPWPFPANVMLGFTARAETTDIRRDPEEIASAAWFSRETLRNTPEDEGFTLPKRDSIARRLIEDWVAQKQY